MKGTYPMRLISCACVMLAFTWASARAHPHDDDPEIIVLRGTVTKVDAVNRAIEIDIVAPKAMAPRNVLVFVDRKVKLRDGKARMDISLLKPGQRVTCTVEREHDEGGGGERLTAFQIRLDTRT